MRSSLNRGGSEIYCVEMMKRSGMLAQERVYSPLQRLPGTLIGVKCYLYTGCSPSRCGAQYSSEMACENGILLLILEDLRIPANSVIAADWIHVCEH